jgi:glycosyltransferase involved in cell wall biosynthesis
MYSIIIPAKNASKDVARTIRSARQSVDRCNLVEVIVVDNGSSDDTREIAKMEGAKVFLNQTTTISGLRNLGVKNASHDIIGFIDADCEALPEWLENARSVLLSDSTIGIVGDYYRLPENANWIETAYFSDVLRARRDVPYLSGGNMVMRKEVFLKIGGFDEKTITGEDYVLCQKVKSAGFRVVSDPSVAVVHHGNSKTLGQLFKREKWYGLGMFDLLRYGKLTLPLVWALLNLIFLGASLLSIVLGRFYLAAVLIILVLLMPAGAAFHRCIRNRGFRYLLPLYPIFVIYGLARSASIVQRLKWW